MAIPLVDQLRFTRSEFLRGLEGLSEKDMITFGPTQRTLAQFTEAGWKVLERFS